MAGLNIIIMAVPLWQSRLLGREELSEKVAVGETATKISSKSSALLALAATPSEAPLPAAQPTKAVMGGKRKDSSGPPNIPKRPHGSSSNVSQPASQALSLSSQKGKEIRKGTPLRLAGPPLSSHLGKPALDLTGEECEAVFTSLSDGEVNDRLKKVDFPSLRSVVSDNLMQASLVTMEVLRRAEKATTYREELRNADKALKKLEAEKKTWLKQMADVRSQLSRQEKEAKEAEEKILALSWELKEKEQQALLNGMEGCREQILLTPVGQQFLQVLKEELIKSFCRSPHMIDAFGDAITALLEAGRKFALAKLSAEDLTPKEDFKEMVMQAPDLNKIMGIDEGMTLEHPWWMEGFSKAYEVFVRGSFSDPTYPTWGVLQFPLAPCPDGMLPFHELDKKIVGTDTDFSPEHTPDAEFLALGSSQVDSVADEEMVDPAGNSSPPRGASSGNIEEPRDSTSSPPASTVQPSSPTI